MFAIETNFKRSFELDSFASEASHVCLDDVFLDDEASNVRISDTYNKAWRRFLGVETEGFFNRKFGRSELHCAGKASNVWA